MLQDRHLNYETPHLQRQYLSNPASKSSVFPRMYRMRFHIRKREIPNPPDIKTNLRKSSLFNYNPAVKLSRRPEFAGTYLPWLHLGWDCLTLCSGVFCQSASETILSKLVHTLWLQPHAEWIKLHLALIADTCVIMATDATKLQRIWYNVHSATLHFRVSNLV